MPRPRRIDRPESLFTEAQFQDTVIAEAKLWGWKCFYIPDSARAGAVGRPKGWPDLSLCHPVMGIFLFAELKIDTADSKLSTYQCDWLSWLHDCGETVQVWRPSIWDHIETVLGGPAPDSWAALNNPDIAQEWKDY